MSKILISGLVNTETTVGIHDFPITYSPIEFSTFGIQAAVSGVGMNLAKALKALGNEVELFSYIGNDCEGENILEALKTSQIGAQFVKKALKSTSQSVVLYDEAGRRKIYCDLKDLQDRDFEWDEEAEKLISKMDAVLLCNINFSRPLIKKAKELGKLIVTDVHVLSDIHDAYNKEFMQNADVLFLSNENIMRSEEDIVRKLKAVYPAQVIIVGMGSQGALLYVRSEDCFKRFPAVTVRKVVNTVGAGDALLSAFVHFYLQDSDPYTALEKAILFAGYKIGESGAAKGFIDEKELLELYRKA